MTLLSKVQTLIDYAKLGMFFIQASNYDGKNDRLKPLHFPNGIVKFNSNLIQYATGLTGGIVSFVSATNYAKDNTTIEYINLPKCANFGGWGSFSGMTALKECRAPSLAILANDTFVNCGNLEIFEVGALTYFSNGSAGSAMVGNPKVHTFIIGKGTSCSLYLHRQPLLTQECLHNIIDNLADRTGLTALTLQIGSDNIAKLSEEYKTKLFAKNWTLK